MSRDDRLGEYEENWKKRQDERVDERARQFQEEFRKQQDKAQEKVKADGQDAADALLHIIEPKEGHDGGHAPAVKDVHYTVGMPDYHEVEVHADHHGIGDPVIAVMVVVDVMRRVKEAVDIAGFVKQVNESLDGRPLEELRASISGELGKFSDKAEQAFGDFEKWVMERVSPEKAQEIPQPGAPALEASPLEPGRAPTGKGEAERDGKDLETAALKDKQAKELAELEEKLTAARDRLEARNADKPKDVRDSLVDTFNAAAKDARDDKAAQHAEELRKLKEEQDRDRDDR
jgi:hypothetical protein